MMSESNFITAINCMDGRVQVPVIEWLKQNYNKNYVDMITEPGPNLILAENEDSGVVKSIKERVGISVNKHGSNTVAVVGHYDCAGNPAERKGQIKQIKTAIDRMEDWELGVEFIGLWVNRAWEVEKVAK